jgi:ATP phosphoribosyltransferase
VIELAGSIELAPELGLADLALDIVQTGATLAAHDLVELEVVREIAPCFVVQRAAWQVRRPELLGLVERLEGAGVAA